jgi:ribosome recycling factor
MEELDAILSKAEKMMEESVIALQDRLDKIRAGRANPKLLDDIRVMYYGNMTPLKNVATVVVPDARTLIITPWEKKILKDIEKAIIDSSLGITPSNSGENIRITIPPLTGERRQELAKQVKAECEDAKISVRNARRDANDSLKKLISEGLSEDIERDNEEEVQKLHNKYIKQIETAYTAKEKEIITV